MSGTAGALKEGFVYNYGPRYNDTFFRGVATFTGASIVITLPLPMRFAGFPQATIVSSIAPTGTTASTVTVSVPVANHFTIFAWVTAAAGTWTAPGGGVTTVVNWEAWGTVTDNFVSGAY
jgi:hypothetical protein